MGFLLNLFGGRRRRKVAPTAISHLSPGAEKLVSSSPEFHLESPSQCHEFGCSCPDLSSASCVSDESSLEIRALLDLDRLHTTGDSTHLSCTCATAGGRTACLQLHLWYFSHLSVNGYTPIGSNFRLSDFAGSPQQHALLNRHLLSYFRQRAQSQRSTPYNIPASQRHLLQPLGMEEPEPDAPETPHAFHKSLEEFQLSRMGQYLPGGQYGVISVKTSKLQLLPPAGSVQNPVFEAKDASRYPGTAVRHATLANHEVNFMHDVSSVVPPHALVEKLVSENPEGHLFVTGINPAEVLDGAKTFEPASHTIEYDLDSFNFVFTGSESEAYFTPTWVTKAWLRTSSVCASNGRVYHVVLLNYALGHCIWHIFCGEATEQDARTFSTGSMVRLPAALTGTLSDEYLPVQVLSGVLDFTRRTPDLSTRNLAAKVTQLANGINPRTTSRERWICTFVASQQAPIKTWDWFVRRGFWNLAYFLSFQWQMFKSSPDIYDFIDERKRCRTIHPTQGGGWSHNVVSSWRPASIPNYPTMLQRVSAWSASAFTFILPKLLIGEVISEAVFKLPLAHILHRLWDWMDLRPLRILLTVCIVVVTAILPGHVVKVFSRLAGHFYRQLWWPGYLRTLFQRLVTEFTGAPGAIFLDIMPGHGWCWQVYIWSLALLSLLPNLMPHYIVPWLAGTMWPVPVAIFALVLLENVLALYGPASVPVLMPQWTGRLWGYRAYSPFRVGNYCFRYLFWLVSPSVKNRGNCGRVPGLPSNQFVGPTSVSTPSSDYTLTPTLVMPANIPGAPAGVALAVPPTGFDFPEWVRAVEAAYATNPNTFPQLTPGQHCFWDCVSSFGGSAHMWYSWYMSYFQKLPDPNDPVIGNVTEPEIQVFCAASCFGLDLSGKIRAKADPGQASWPTLSLHIGNQLVNGRLHVQLATSVDPGQELGNLARVLATVLVQEPNSWAYAEGQLLRSALDSNVQPTPHLLAWAGQLSIGGTRDHYLAAFAASQNSAPFANNNAGTGFPFAQFLGFTNLIEIHQPVHSARIAGTDDATMWRRYRALPSRVRAFADRIRANRCVPEKIGASPTRPAENRRRNNQVPDVSRWWIMRKELEESLEPWRNVVLPDVPLAPEELQFTPDVDLAAKLVSDLKAHPEVLGPRGDKVILQSLDSIIDLHRLEGTRRSRTVTVYFGVSGCGKTTATRKVLNTMTPDERADTRIVCHTESLRAKTRLSLKYPEMRGRNFPTIASVLTEPSTGTLVFDDAGKFWGGALDLILLTNPMVTRVIVNGDPAQGRTCFPVRGTQSEHDPTAIEVLSRSSTRYATRSYRLFRLLADTLGVYTTNSEFGHITHTVGPKHGIPVCTASPRYVGVLAGAGRTAFTFESVQGEDFPTDMEVDMTGLEGSVSDRTAYVALTRSTTGVYVHMDAANPTSVIRAPPTGSDLMNSLVFAMRSTNSATLGNPDWIIKAAFYRHLSWCLPSHPWFARIGASVDASEFQNILPACNYAPVCDFEPTDARGVETSCPADGPVDHWLPETHHLAKEHREVPQRGGTTDQFKEVAFVNPHVHKRQDTPTYFLSVSKRLTTRTAIQNLNRMKACPRADMCGEFDRLVPVVPQLTAAKFESLVDLSVDEYCQTRTRLQVLAKVEAFDPDRTGSDIKISLKNQVIKKAEKRHKTEAIPGQLIHEYDLSQTLGDSAYALFLENELTSAFPSNFLFYRRMSPSAFIEAYRRSWRVDNGAYSSDVTRWDVGCDAGMVNFDVHVMRRCGFPEDYIQSYINRRLSSRSQHGPMGTMQNSGDRYTWILNTIRRAVVTSLVCKVTAEDTLAINGDDAAIDRYAVAEVFPDSPWEFKDVNARRVEFSGFQLGGPEPQYDAEGIVYRTMILESRDPTAQDKWINYLDLLRYCDMSSEAAMSVAHRAKLWMEPDLFAQFLPAPMMAYFNLSA